MCPNVKIKVTNGKVQGSDFVYTITIPFHAVTTNVADVINDFDFYEIQVVCLQSNILLLRFIIVSSMEEVDQTEQQYEVYVPGTDPELDE